MTRSLRKVCLTLALGALKALIGLALGALQELVESFWERWVSMGCSQRKLGLFILNIYFYICLMKVFDWLSEGNSAVLHEKTRLGRLALQECSIIGLRRKAGTLRK